MPVKLNVWFDRESDYLDVRFTDGAGYMQPTDKDEIMLRVDARGSLIGFTVLGLTRSSRNGFLSAVLSAD